MENWFNKVFLSFDPINPEFSPGNRIIDTHANHFSFHLFNKHISYNIKFCIQKLNRIALESSNISSSTLVIIDTSIKNNVATSIAHIHIHDKPIMKTLHYALNITTTEAKLFVIRCGINQATNNCAICKIIVVMDSIHTAQNFFDLSSHLFQKHSVFILKDFQIFFFHHPENYIEFWECPSHCNWYSHKVVDMETKSFRPIPMFLSKLSWDFSKKNKCDDLVNKWKMTFEASDLKGKHFLNLVDGDNNSLEPSYIRGSSWLQNFGHFNSLYVRAFRTITNYVPIANIDSGSSQIKNLGVLVNNILSNQDVTYYTSAEDLMSIGIWEEILLLILSCSSTIILMCLLFQIPLLNSLWVDLIVTN